MKKVLSFLLALCLCLGVLAVPAFAEEAAPADAELTANQIIDKYMQPYDVDKDGSITVSDASLLLRIVSKIDASDKSYDTDFNGTTDLMDVRNVLNAAATGADVIPADALLEIFNQELNAVKMERPGFTRTTTGQISSMKVTTSGAPINTLNVKDTEYVDYVKKMKSLMTLIGKRDEYEEMLQQAEDVYKPNVAETTVEAGSTKHYTNFPVYNLSWSSRLTSDDIAAGNIRDISYVLSDDKIVITLKMNDFTYYNNEFPREREAIYELPYGRIFNLSAMDDDTVVMSYVKLYNGIVVLTVDRTTETLAQADYSYQFDVTSTKNETVTDENNQDSSDITMTVASKASEKESYVLGAAAAAQA